MPSNPVHAIERLAVIGAGPAGLFAAHLARQQGLQVALFEAHSKPGGCASWFRRKFSAGSVLFDAGATVLNDFHEGAFLRRLTQRLGVAPPPFTRLTEMRYRLHGRAFTLDARSADAWIASLAAAFPADALLIRTHFTPLARHARRLHAALTRVPHWPIEGWADLRLNAPLLGSLMGELPEFARGLGTSFGQDLERWQATAELRRWVDMNLLITLQAPARAAHPLWAAMALFFYPLGAGSLPGGMKSLFEPLLSSLQHDAGARVFMNTGVSAAHEQQNKFIIETDRGAFGPFDGVISAVPRYDTRRLFRVPLFGGTDDWRRLGPHVWGALTGYFAVSDHARLPATSFHLHATQADDFETALEGGDAYFSFSPRDCPDRAPPGYRAVTASSHTRLARWPQGPDRAQRHSVKIAAAQPLRAHLTAAFPEVEIAFEDYGSPWTFARYTRRAAGGVGGLPLNLAFTGFGAPSIRTFHPRVWQIGDTSFPGQSVLGCAVGALAAIEKLTGRKILGLY